MFHIIDGGGVGRWAGGGGPSVFSLYDGVDGKRILCEIHTPNTDVRRAECKAGAQRSLEYPISITPREVLGIVSKKSGCMQYPAPLLGMAVGDSQIWPQGAPFPHFPRRGHHSLRWAINLER